MLRELLEVSPMPMFVGTAERQMRILAVNQRFTRQFGYREADLATGESWWSLAFPDPEYRTRVEAAWGAALERALQLGHGPGEPLEARVSCLDRSVRRVAFYFGMCAGRIFVLCNDVTAQRSVEAELKEAREFLQCVVDASPSMIFVVDELGRIVFASRTLAEYYATTPEALLSKATEAIHANTVQAKSFLQDDLDVIRTGRPIVKQELNTAPDGRVHWFHTVKVQLTRPDGRVHCLGISTDITAQKEAEQARLELEAQVWQSQKLESLGVLAGGVAHDFNNLVTSIRSNAYLALARLPEDSAARPFLAGIELATRRAAELTSQMLTYGGRSQPSLELLRLDDLASEMRALLQAVVSKKAVFQFELGPAMVEADPAQLRQVIMNLLTNASDSLGDHPGRIAIRTGTRELGSDELRSRFVESTPPAGRYAFLEVEDDGCGMTYETLARMCEPFFSTKFMGRGLGLSVVLGIVRGHRGTLQVESALGKGARFVVLLPQVSAAPSVGVAPTEARAARGTLLLVDDEDLVRTTSSVMLEDAGFRVLAAADGQEGLELFERHMAEIDAVILDLTMPRLDGEQCLRRLRALRPGIPVLLMSGYSVQGAVPTDLSPAPAF
ncbi:MAG TPA: PAS domain-containing protein, partial [Polyangiaceae bacterium]|nr:PAS domain-containing protein [Polyangiaceae bacterium]